MSTTSVKLLWTASELLGGDKVLAERLGMGETLLAKFIADILQLPDPLLLRAVDIIFEERQSRFALPGQPGLHKLRQALAERAKP